MDKSYGGLLMRREGDQSRPGSSKEHSLDRIVEPLAEQAITRDFARRQIELPANVSVLNERPGERRVFLMMFSPMTSR